MAEYIEREAVFKIVADMMCDCKVRHKGRAINRNIKQLPTVDVVPVVRCEKCVFWDTESKGFSDEHICKMHSVVSVHSRYTNPTDFCSYGEGRCSNADTN